MDFWSQFCLCKFVSIPAAITLDPIFLGMLLMASVLEAPFESGFSARFHRQKTHGPNARTRLRFELVTSLLFTA